MPGAASNAVLSGFDASSERQVTWLMRRCALCPESQASRRCLPCSPAPAKIVFDRDGFQELGRLTLQGVRGTVLRLRQSTGGTLALVIDSKSDQLEADNWIALIRPSALPGN
jgi:hypothetical protein